MTPQLLYIALGFGVGLTVAAAVGTIALLRWTGKPKVNTRRVDNPPEADRGASDDAPTGEATSEAESERSAPFRDSARQHEKLAKIDEDSDVADLERYFLGRGTDYADLEDDEARRIAYPTRR